MRSKSDFLEETVNVAAAVVSQQLQEPRTVKHIRLDYYKEFSEILKIKYDNNEEEINKNEEYEFDRVVSFGLSRLMQEETGYELIHNGKKAEKRVMKKLGNIAYQLLQIYSYPKLDASVLSQVLSKALGNIDRRTILDYRKTILYYCNIPEDEIDMCKDSRLGQLNVSGFVKRIPKTYFTNNSL